MHSSTSIRAVVLGGKLMSPAPRDAMLAEAEEFAAKTRPRPSGLRGDFMLTVRRRTAQALGTLAEGPISLDRARPNNPTPAASGSAATPQSELEPGVSATTAVDSASC